MDDKKTTKAMDIEPAGEKDRKDEVAAGKNVYLITTGSYSDYRVVTACSTREIAEGIVSALKASKPSEYQYYQIEEYELDACAEIPRGYHIWRVQMDRDGNVRDEPLMDVPDDKIDMVQFYRDEMCYVHVVARDAKQAIKAANEKRAMHIATYGWGKGSNV